MIGVRRPATALHRRIGFKMAHCFRAKTVTLVATMAVFVASGAGTASARSRTPRFAAAQQNAIRAANQYLSVSAFSKKGLIQQLSSSAGSGFSKSLAVFAVNHVHVSWNKEATKAAKSYLSTQAFSRRGLIQQLDSTAGAGFTPAQAVYGVKHVRVNWNKEAVKAAKSYLSSSAFSCQDLVQQLDSAAGSGFTRAQATYAAKKVGIC